MQSRLSLPLRRLRFIAVDRFVVKREGVALLTGRRGLSTFPTPESSFLNVKDFPDHVVTATDSPASPTVVLSTPIFTYNPNSVKLGVNLTKYGLNLSKLAFEGKLEAVIGRDKEIQQTIQILSRRRKNNPCLIGEPGVGKTSIAEGLANMIVAGNVPDSMKDKVIITLDLAGMVAGTKFRGEFEDRLKGVLKEIEISGDRIILFIDEMHSIVGAGGSEGAIDASNILKPALARGSLRCMGTTTTDEFSKYIEKDAALARRFQSVFVDEPTEKDTVSILQGLRKKYESHHRVRITDEAIEAAVHLAGRYLTGRRFPDKALDLVDEAASRLRNRIESTPAHLLQVERDIEALHGRIEAALLTRRDVSLKDELALYRLNEEKQRLVQRHREQNVLLGTAFEVNNEIVRLKGALQSERRAATNVAAATATAHVEKVQQLVADIVRNESLMADIYQRLESTDHELSGDHHRTNQRNDSSTAHEIVGKPGAQLPASLQKFRNTLEATDMAEIIAQSTGIPVSSILDKEHAKSLLRLEDVLREQIIGQDEAVSAIAKCIRLSRAGLRFHDRPMGVFLMLGPTGVGKTELAKALCAFLFKDQPSTSSFLRLDMSEYMERFSVSRLIGAPPGYVGYDEGGVLTDAVRRRPYQLILLDEFEKAHREVSNLLLQVFDEGRLTDSHGRVVDFRNTVIILTSNLGADMLSKAPKFVQVPVSRPEEKSIGESESSNSANSEVDPPSLSRSELATRLVHQHFSPEFVNRLDEVIVFNPLNEAAMLRICEIQLRKVKELLVEKKIDFNIDNAAEVVVATRGSDLRYGARPLKRFIQNEILSPLANQILDGSITKGDQVYLSTVGQSLAFAKESIDYSTASSVETHALSAFGGQEANGLEVTIVKFDQ